MLSGKVSVRPSVHSSVRLSVRPSVCPSVRPSVHIIITMRLHWKGVEHSGNKFIADIYDGLIWVDLYNKIGVIKNINPLG